MYKKAYNLIVYALTGVVLVLGVILKTNLTIYLMAIIFFIWDLGFVREPDSFAGHTVENTIQQLIAVRTYMSYFFAFYGILIGVLLSVDDSKRKEFLEIIDKSGISLTLLIAPFFFASMALFFIPIQLSDGSKRVSTPLKYLLFVNIYGSS